MDKKCLKPKYEAPRIISLEEIGSSIGGSHDPSCYPGSTAYNCGGGNGGTQPAQCSAGTTP